MREYQRHSRDLANWRVGLSGAVPEPEAWGGRPLDYEIQEFVSSLSDGVLRHGGVLVHGSHPSFTPRILDRALVYGKQYGRKVARFYMYAVFTESDVPEQVGRYADVAEMVLIPQVGEGTAADKQVRDASLTRMRQVLIADMDVLVVVGGKHHADTGFSPDTKQELDMAIGRGLPCFLVGGLGGMGAELAAEYPLEVLGNGLLPESNKELESTTDLNQAAGIIIAALRSLYRETPSMEDKIKHLI